MKKRITVLVVLFSFSIFAQCGIAMAKDAGGDSLSAFSWGDWDSFAPPAAGPVPVVAVPLSVTALPGNPDPLPPNPVPPTPEPSLPGDIIPSTPSVTGPPSTPTPSTAPPSLGGSSGSSSDIQPDIPGET